ncbi:dihydropteroate synthase [Rhodobacter maris]|uniref:Dihydropteroate synthase n=1 Tax=Rhodobacter maris TaxID=446682 RepID=A0A285SC66_9RHOB|nr:dihydropteroate synthase [Rhodobacter maris]SOC04893.1 dihydropteroate synthase [Rhodobacter maris]
MLYYRPIAQTDVARPAGAFSLAGGWCWFDTVEVLSRAGSQGRMPAADLPAEVLARLTAPRSALAGVSFDRPSIMGILNVTPDSFSDGGKFDAPEAARARAQTLLAAGADMLDIGGESTRPGAAEVPVEEEISRTAPVIAALVAQAFPAPISIDTRKAPVAAAAVLAGAGLVNDVSAMLFDPAMAATVARTDAALCLMHAQGRPETMQAAPAYDDVLLDVYDHLAERLAAAEATGIARARVLLDPGIGFGKTLDHNLALLRGLSLFHGLGCPLLLGVSRKRFIGTIGGAPEAEARAPGTLAVTLAAIAQGVQMHRVHDVAEIAQGIRLYGSITRGYTA